MGDGKIALILDAFGLARGLEPPREAGDGQAGSDLVGDLDGLAGSPEALVLLQGTGGGPMAIPMADVERLETFPSSSIEWVADRPLVPYRKALMPLVDVEAWLAGGTHAHRGAIDEGRPWQVVVHSHEGRRLGLVFGRVLDVVEQRLSVRGDTTRPGVRVTAVIQGRATEVLDVPMIRSSVRFGD
jgi:two-component system chemotaxis sensor kinase CheA